MGKLNPKEADDWQLKLNFTLDHGRMEKHCFYGTIDNLSQTTG